MSNKYTHSAIKDKEEAKNQKEPDALYNLDVQLLSSLKPIPGKIIALNNEITPVLNKNNKENNHIMNIKDTYNNIMNDSINSINFHNNNEMMNINNNNFNNNFNKNNYILNNGFNNTNLNFSPYNYQKNNSGIIQNSFLPRDNQNLYPPSNNQSLLSFKSDKNYNNFWSDIKLTQNSFTHNIIMYNNENLKGNIKRNNIINNNLRLSQLSYQLSNIGNDEHIKKKKSNSIILKKNSDNINIINLDEMNKSINNDYNINYEKKKSGKQTKEKIINIKEEEEEKNENNEIFKEKNKKIFFNIENFYDVEEEEDDTIYHNINNNRNDISNLFNCYLKKKKKRKKINDAYKFKCSHPKCEFSYKTKKQLQSHHYKMTPECQLDSVQIIKLINDTKGILKNIIKNNHKKIEKFEKLYENHINKISLKNYFEFIAGSHFNDEK